MYEELLSKSKRVVEMREQLVHYVRLHGIEQQKKLFEHLKRHTIRDRLVPPKAMTLSSEEWGLHLQYADGTGASVHPHALRQMCTRAEVPSDYIRRLASGDGWERELACHVLNETFAKREFYDRRHEPLRFLHRLVSDELRGFLSASFNPRLSTAALLRPYIETCGEFGAGPVAATVTDVRMSVRCCLPDVFEPIDGEFVAFGNTFSNSDFGAGGLQVSLTVMRLGSWTSSVVENGYRRVHLGRVLQDSDIELDDDATRKEVEAQQAAIRSAVREQFAPKTLEVFIKAIQVAKDQKIEWYRLKDRLRKVLNKSELGTMEAVLRGVEAIVDLPPLAKTGDEATADLWWAANCVSWLAEQSADADHKGQLQALSGDLLGVKDDAA